MVRTLFLHIGMHKTGSTAIQLSLTGYDDGTTAYLDLFNPNHSYGMSMLFCEEKAPDLIKAGWAKSLADWHQQAAANRRRMKEHIASGRQNLIISGEDLSSRFGRREIERLWSAVAADFDEIRVIVYLREPYAFLQSALQEVIKRRSCTIKSVPLPRYRQRLEPWEAFFGRGAIDYVLYSPDSAAGRDVVGDIAARVGLTLDRVTKRRANESMSAETFAMLYWLRNSPNVSTWKWPVQRVQAVAKRPHGFGHQRFAFSESVWQDRVAAHGDEIAWAEARMGRRFAREPAHPDAVVFKAEADILALAAEHEAAFRRWSKEIMPFRKLVESYVQQQLEGG